MKDIDELRECGISFDDEEVWAEPDGKGVKMVSHEDLSIGRLSLEKLLENEDFVSIHFCSETNSINIVYKE